MLDIDALIDSQGGLYRTSFPDGVSLAWRLLSLREYQVFASLRDGGVLIPWMVYSKVFERCYTGDARLLHSDLPAGYEISIGQLIMWLSGDTAGTSQKEDIEAARAHYQADSVHELMKQTVMLAFPTYTLEDVEGWSRLELIRKFTVAETMLVRRGIGYEPMDTRKIMSPEDARRQQQIDFARENRETERAMGNQGDHILDRAPDEFAHKRKVAQAMEQRGFRPRRRS